MPVPPPLFDAVVFDLDGTLVATDRFWIDAARVGARRAFAELGLDRPMPTALEWMSLVGLPLATGFARLFPDLHPAARARVQELCEEEEHAALRAGGAALLPGVEETLEELRSAGVRLGVASNCGHAYLASMMDDLSLAQWIEEARCLDSAGVANKADMVAQVLDAFGTRSAVMVGDRLGDRDAAWANGLPHVHFARGFAPEGEDVEAEAVIETMLDLVPRLARRTDWIERALRDLGARDGARRIGVTGPPGSGKSLFARDAARLLAAHGVRAEVVALDDHRRPDAAADLASTAFVSASRPLELLEHGYDVAAFLSSVERAAERGLAIAQGSFLLHAALRPHVGRVVHLDVDEATSLRRLAGRDVRAHGADSLLVLRRHLLPAARAFDALVPPREHAVLVLDARNPLGE
jgi:phosphoglycolate phosphatase